MQIEQALLLEVCFGDPLEPRSLLFAHRRLALIIEHLFESPLEPMGVCEYLAYELPNPRLSFFRTNGMAHGASILYPTVVTSRATVVATAFRSNVIYAHSPTAFCAPHHAAGKLPYLFPSIGDPFVILYGFPCSNDPFFRDAGIRNWNRYPLFPWGRYALLDFLVACCAVRGALTPLCVNVTFCAIPPHAVVTQWIEGTCYFLRNKLGDLLEGVREIGVVVNAVSQILSTPTPPSRRGSYAFFLQCASGRVKRHALRTHHAEDPPNHDHLVLLYKIAIAFFVEAEAVVRARSCHHLALCGLTPLAPVHPLSDLLALPRRDDVQDVVAKLAVGRIVAPTIQRDESGSVLAKLFGEKLRIDAPSDAIAEEDHHRVHLPTNHHLSDPIQSGAF